MDFGTALAIFGAGFVLLAVGGEAAIRGGVVLKRALGLSPVIIGLFALSLGSAGPSLAVAASAASSHAPDLVLGTVIGAVLVNLLLILGLGALIRPMPSPPKVVLRDGVALLLAIGLFCLLAQFGTIGRREGVILLGGFAIYAIVAVMTDWRRSSLHSVACAEAERRCTGEEPSVAGGLFALIIGCICLIIGAHFLIGASLSLSSAWSIAPGAFAATAIALAVSLPVFGVTAIAALRGHTQIAVGHLLAVSIFDILGALGVAALVRPLPVAPAFQHFDRFALLGAIVFLLPLLSAHWRLTRLKGAFLFLLYLGYVITLAWGQGLLTGRLIGI